MMDKTVFLDRDGTINLEVNYLHRPEDLKLLPGVAEGIRALNEGGFNVIVVTNQAGVARGYYQEQDVETLHVYLNELLAEHGAHIDGFYYCPHHPLYGIGGYKKECHCRKPETGMLEAAARDFNVYKSRAWLMGDNEGDILAGRNYGIKTVLVATGYGRQVHQDKPGICDYYADNFQDGIQWILESDKKFEEAMRRR